MDANGKFIDMIANGLDKHKAYKIAYNCKTSKARSVMNEPDIVEGLQDRFKADGITIRRLNKRLKDKLEAKKVVYHKVNMIAEKVDDNEAQMDAIKTGYKLLGALKDNQPIIDNRQVTFTGNIDHLIEVMKECKASNERAVIDTSGEVIS